MSESTTKRCPGFDPQGESEYRQAPHELPATLEFFHSNAGNRDGLSTRCRPCGKAYGNAWAAARRKGESFSARRPKSPADQAVAQAKAEVKASRRIERAITEQPRNGKAEEAQRHLDAAIAEVEGQPGWATRMVAGLRFPYPTESYTVETPAGQAALEAINEAQRLQRREQKRAERARKAQAEVSAQA